MVSTETGHTCRGGAAVDRWVCGTCPAAEPTNASACTTANLACSYDGTTCTCTAAAAGGRDRWNCVVPCPATEPTAGATCDTAATMMCPYGNVTCRCEATATGRVWTCT